MSPADKICKVKRVDTFSTQPHPTECQIHFVPVLQKLQVHELSYNFLVLIFTFVYVEFSLHFTNKQF